jgi:hypothetical protein
MVDEDEEDTCLKKTKEDSSEDLDFELARVVADCTPEPWGMAAASWN